MEFWTITPTKFMSDAFKTSNTTLVLAHLIQPGNNYQKACLNFKRKKGVLVLDNSFYELRENGSMEWLCEKARLIRAGVLTFPDTPYREDLKEIVTNGIRKIKDLGYEGKIMMCVYANNNNFDEDLQQFKILNDTSDIDIISIPYVFRESDEFRRPSFLKMIDNEIKKDRLKINKHIHLFGVNSLKNLEKEKKFKWVKSVDSTFPWKMGYYETPLSFIDDEDISRPKNYFNINKITEKQRVWIDYNLNFIKQLLK